MEKTAFKNSTGIPVAELFCGSINRFSFTESSAAHLVYEIAIEFECGRVVYITSSMLDVAERVEVGCSIFRWTALSDGKALRNQA